MVAFPAASTGGGSATRTPVDPSVPGHRRGGRGWLRSVRTQLLVPIVVAIAGLVALGTVQTLTATAAASDARRAQVLATTATATVRLVHEIEREAAETVALRQRGGRSGAILVSSQQKRTDAAMVRYRQSVVKARVSAPSLGLALVPAETALTGLDAARTLAEATPTAAAGDKAYRDIAAAVLSIADALPGQIQDPDLASRARSVAAVAAIEYFNSLERDALYTAFTAKKFSPGALASLAAIFGGREQREAEFLRSAANEDRLLYTNLMQGPDIEKAQQMRGSVLSADRNGTELSGDQEAWYIAQSNVIRRVNMVSLALSERLDRAATRVAADAERRAILVGAGSVVLAAGVLFAAVLFAVRTSRRLRSLRAAALAVARSELPHTINAVITGKAPPATDGPSATSVTLNLAVSQDEVGQVADAFATVHHTALRLASEQAEVRVDVARMAETLARRIRTLITRQLRLLDEFERDETDPEVLARLFVLDHIAARLRRNGENLLVLAGGEPGRGVTSAVPLAVVATAAASEIEEFQRVHVSIGPLAVASHAVGDVVHLLAELLENAAVSSPPETVVHVEAQVTDSGGVLVQVHDGGLGIAPSRLDELNQRLRRPGALTSAAAGTMGLNVVAHLAQRHDIAVRLASVGTGRGTVAYVELPKAVMAPYDAALLAGPPDAVESGLRPALPGGRVRSGLRRTPGAGAPGGAYPARSPGGAPGGAYPARSPGGAPGGAYPARSPGGAYPAREPATAGAGLFVKHTGPVDAPPAGYLSVAPRAEAAPLATVNGLPRRRPGGAAAASQVAFPDLPESVTPMDPDEVRSRLSSFADGVAAAARRTSAAGA
jgi:signal transduction histidine kinase